MTERRRELAQFTADEQRALRAAFVAGDAVRCPRCDVAMHERAIGGGSFGLGYARKREWLMCPRCRRSVMFDVKRGTRN
ncbi:MAG: hypothetical protein H3C62_03495 [Gemmatimonadaceae bacterium]|nr:hypothetical protein [Gemmatimonadaceae bacterium]